jgi:hypothetical protein
MIELVGYMLKHLKIIVFLSTGVMATDTTTSGSQWGLAYTNSAWTLQKFDTKPNAFSLCTFTGELYSMAGVEIVVIP